MPKPSVRRDRSPRAISIFGPAYWWTVYLTPWQPVASFDSFRNALGYAQFLAMGMPSADVQVGGC